MPASFMTCQTQTVRLKWQHSWSCVHTFQTSIFNKLDHHLISSHLSLNHEGRWGTTDDLATSFLHFSLFSTALWDLANFRPVHSLLLSSQLFFCLPCLLPPFTVPCKMVLARPDERETCLYHFSLRLFTMVRSSSDPIANICASEPSHSLVSSVSPLATIDFSFCSLLHPQSPPPPLSFFSLTMKYCIPFLCSFGLLLWTCRVWF